MTYDVASMSSIYSILRNLLALQVFGLMKILEKSK